MTDGNTQEMTFDPRDAQPLVVTPGNTYDITVLYERVEVRFMNPTTQQPHTSLWIYAGEVGEDGTFEVEESGYLDETGLLKQANGEGSPPELGDPIPLKKGKRYHLAWAYRPTSTSDIDPDACQEVVARAEIPLAMDFAPGGTLQLQLVDPRGRPLANTSYWAQGPDGTKLQGTTNAEGNADHEDVPFATYLVSADGRYRGTAGATPAAAPRQVVSMMDREGPSVSGDSPTGSSGDSEADTPTQADTPTETDEGTE